MNDNVKLLVSAIHFHCADVWKVKPEFMFKRDRHTPVVEAKVAAAFICWKLLKVSSNQIGQMLGFPYQNSTVSQRVMRCLDLIQTEPAFKEKVEKIVKSVSEQFNITPPK